MASTAISKYRTAVKVATAQGAAKNITAITKAASAVVTSSAHGLTVGTVVVFAAVGGMIELNDLVGVITAQDANTFTLNIDSSAFTAYTSGGTATPQTMTLVENVTGFDRAGEEADTADSTNLQSTKKEYVVLLAGEGTVSLAVHVDATGPGQAAVRAKVGTDTAQAVTVTRSDSKTEAMMVKWTNFSESFPDLHAGTFSGRITGAVSWYG